MLINGQKGEVVDFKSSGPVLRFGKQVLPLKKYVFDVYDPTQGKVLATRTQYPLKLAYSLTMHRAQGLTLERLVANCNGVRNAGQIGVAVGRAVCTEVFK